MSTTKKITLSLLALTVLLLVSWDVYVAFNWQKGDTISEVWMWLEGHSIALPFAFGIICGHLCWPQYKKEN